MRISKMKQPIYLRDSFIRRERVAQVESKLQQKKAALTTLIQTDLKSTSTVTSNWSRSPVCRLSV